MCVVYDLVVLGAGASGLMAAWEASRRGARVAVVDHAAVAGRKLRISGGGKGNVTNRMMGPECFVGEQPEFCAPIVRRLGPERIMALLAQLHIPLEEREYGQMFCLTPAARLVGALYDDCVRHGAQMLLRRTVLGVDDISQELLHKLLQKVPLQLSPKIPSHVSPELSPDVSPALPFSEKKDREPGTPQQASGFCVRVRSEDGSESALYAHTLLIALGGPAWPQSGASDYGQRLARQWGHKIIPVRPVLAPFIMPQDWPLHGLSGISLTAKVQVTGPAGTASRSACTGAKPSLPRAFTRPLLFTHKGLSGPAILHASCFWHSGQALVIDFLPDADLRELMHDPAHGKLMLRSLICRHLPERLVDRLLHGELAPFARRKLAELSKATRVALHAAVHMHTVTPLRTEGMAKAEASGGGVATADVNPHSLESRLRPGLFFSGEVLDVAGLLGGYNLHWAWASGLTVGGRFTRQHDGEC